MNLIWIELEGESFVEGDILIFSKIRKRTGGENLLGFVVVADMF